MQVGGAKAKVHTVAKRVLRLIPDIRLASPQFINHQITGSRSAKLEWALVKKAKTYEVSLLAPNGSKKQYRTKAMKYNLGKLAPGVHRYKVRAVTSNGEAGFWSDAKTFRIQGRKPSAVKISVKNQKPKKKPKVRIRVK